MAGSTFKEVEPGLFAIWRYDHFPYFLGGSITHLGSHGNVWTQEYGRGYSFNPVKTLPVDAGHTLLSAIDDLKVERDKALREVEQAYEARLTQLLSPYGISR